jgi:drug/metabolite transporter (DMT)-like permease
MSNAEGRERIGGRLLVLAAATLWSTSGLFAKAPFLDAWPSEQRGLLLAFWRAMFAGVALLPLVRAPRWTVRLIPASLCFAAMNFTFLMAMSTTTEANAIWLQYTAPLWVTLAGAWWLGESAVKRDYWMLACGMLGVGVIVACEWFFVRGIAGNGVGVMWGLLSGLAFAGVVLGLRSLRDQDTFSVIATCHLVAALALAPFVWNVTRPGMEVLVWLACFGILQMAVPYVLFARGVRTLSGHEASYLSLLEPLLVPLWVFLVWRHTPGYSPPAPWTWIGGALILVGLAVRYAPRSSAVVGQP